MTVTEGDSGTVSATSPSPERASGRAVTVDYATANGTATAPGDYLAAAARSTSIRARRRRPVQRHGQRRLLDEANETYFVNLTSPVNATIADGQGLGTITDDDPPPELSIDDVTVTEGNSGTATRPSPSR